METCCIFSCLFVSSWRLFHPFSLKPRNTSLYKNHYMTINHLSSPSFQEKDVYGNEVQRLGRPLPVEYLLVDVPASTPMVPLFTFHERKDVSQYFPVENRMIDGHIQDFAALSDYLAKSRSMDFLEVWFRLFFIIRSGLQQAFPFSSVCPTFICCSICIVWICSR